MTSLRNNLDAIAFFNGLDARHLDTLAAIASSKNYRKGETIFNEGQEAGGLYAVAAGLVRIYKTSFGGKEQILHVFGPGELFAEVAVFRNASLPANAQALEQSEILYIPRDGFIRCIENAPDMALEMLALMSLRLRGFVAKIEELSLKEVPARLAAHLLLLQASQGGATIRLQLPKGQLASLLGTIPETLSRILKKLDEAGIVKTDGQTMRILDQEALQRLAQGEKL